MGSARARDNQEYLGPPIAVKISERGAQPNPVVKQDAVAGTSTGEPLEEIPYHVIDSVNITLIIMHMVAHADSSISTGIKAVCLLQSALIHKHQCS